MQDIWTIVFGTALGFAVAGLCASGHDILSDRRLGFALSEGEGTAGAAFGMLLRVIAGPYLLLRNAYESLGEQDPNPLWIAAAISVACMWGCFSGVIVLDLLGSLPKTAVAGL